MCRVCCSDMNDEEYMNYVYNELMEMKKSKNYDFEKWNTTSVSALFEGLTGHKECKKISVEIMKEFLIWYAENKKDNYFPSGGMERMYSLKCLNNILNKSEDNNK